MKTVIIVKESNEDEFVIGQTGPETRKGLGVIFSELGDQPAWFPQKCTKNMMTPWASKWFEAHGMSVIDTAALLVVPDWMWDEKLLPKVSCKQHAAAEKEEEQKEVEQAGEVEEAPPAAPSVTIAEVEEWVAEHCSLVVRDAVRDVVASPEVSEAQGRWIWENGDAPMTVLEALEGVSCVLDVWTHVRPVILSPEEVARYEAAIRTIDLLLTPRPDRYEIEGYEVVAKAAKFSGTTARVLVPRSWGGKRVKVVRVDP